MPDALSKKGQFEPIHAAHAIEQVVFVLRFETPLEDEIFAQVREATKRFESELDMPRRVRLQGVSFLIHPGVPASSLPPQTSGLMLQRMRADGSIEKELRVDSNSITFMTSLYTRWDAVWMQARGYFEVLAPIYAPHTKIQAVGLNYLDKFEWIGDKSKCRAEALLRVGSEYLCSHIFKAEDFWHSHTGAFIRADEQTKRLLNVNVDFLDEIRGDDIRKVISVTTSLTDLMNQPEYTLLEVSAEQIVKFIDDHTKKLHVFGKNVFANIINEEMSKRIALKG